MSIATFIPTIWSARLLMHLDNALIAKNFFNTDYEGEISDKGDTVRINQIGNISIFNYERNKDMVPPEKIAASSQDLIIDQAQAFNFQIDDIDKVQARAGLMDSAMQRSAYSLAEVEDTYLFNLLAAAVPTANKATVTIESPDEMYELLVHLRTIMVKNNVPSAGRKVAVPPEAVALLLKDDRFVGTGGTNAESTLQSGFVGRAAGFDIYEVNTTPGGNTLIAGHQLASTFASQIVKIEAYRMERRFADGLKGLSVYGAKTLIPQALASVEVTFGTNRSAETFSLNKSVPDIANESTAMPEHEEEIHEDTTKEYLSGLDTSQLKAYAEEHNIDISKAKNNKSSILDEILKELEHRAAE